MLLPWPPCYFGLGPLPSEMITLGSWRIISALTQYHASPHGPRITSRLFGSGSLWNKQPVAGWAHVLTSLRLAQRQGTVPVPPGDQSVLRSAMGTATTLLLQVGCTGAQQHEQEEVVVHFYEEDSPPVVSSWTWA